MKKASFLFILFFLFQICSAQEKIIFFHIPKNGGSTVTDLIVQHYPNNEIFRKGTYFEIENVTEDELRPYSYIMGHFFFCSVLQNLEEYKKITFLREPVQRVLSAHRYWKQKDQANVKIGVYKNHFLPQGDPLYTVTNHQCLFLSSFDPRDPSVTIDQHLQSAKENLANHFFFIGITEELDESLNILYKMLNWEPLSFVPRLNATDPNSERYSEQLLEEIRQRNLADIELYEFAKELYENFKANLQ